MKYLFWLLALVALAAATPAAAQAPAGPATFIDRQAGGYRVVATISPAPATVGPAVVRVALTDAASGAPARVSAVNVIISARSVGRDQLYNAAPLDNDRANGIFESERLYFSISDDWDVRVQVVADAQQFEVAGQVAVGSVYERIIDAAKIAVPATLAALVLLALGWAWFRRQRRRAIA
ncbi:MAG TPA: hypothetical protein VD886_04775 [Herpetosiphonaceae bacterium]|nr:hypothetical protein [Herpetosiphonaceae bacterium]